MKIYQAILLCSFILVANISTSHAKNIGEAAQEAMEIASKLKAQNATLEKNKQKQKQIITSLQNEKKTLENRINSASAEFHKVVQGKKASRAPGWEHVTCPRYGGNLQGHFDRVCRGRRQSVLKFNTHSGDNCGYNYYILACINL